MQQMNSFLKKLSNHFLHFHKTYEKLISVKFTFHTVVFRNKGRKSLLVIWKTITLFISNMYMIIWRNYQIILRKSNLKILLLVEFAIIWISQSYNLTNNQGQFQKYYHTSYFIFYRYIKAKSALTHDVQKYHDESN